eukprot:157829_1
MIYTMHALLRNDSCKKFKNLVIWDWDNTLFPTNQLLQMSKAKRKNIQQTELVALSKSIYFVLAQYIDRYEASNVRILSASREGWIESSLCMVHHIGYFSRIYDLIFVQNQIEVIHPSPAQLPFITEQQVFVWKYNQFCSLLKECQSADCVHTLVSIGDSMHEFKASKSAAKTFDNVYVHRIKLIHHPSLIDMIHEMDLLFKCCEIFEVSSRIDQADITIDYALEKKKRMP